MWALSGRALLRGAGIGGSPGSSFTLILVGASWPLGTPREPRSFVHSALPGSLRGTCLIQRKRGPRVLWQRDSWTLAPTAVVVRVGLREGRRGLCLGHRAARAWGVRTPALKDVQELARRRRHFVYFRRRSTCCVPGPELGVKHGSVSARWISLSSWMWAEGAGPATSHRCEGHSWTRGARGGLGGEAGERRGLDPDGLRRWNELGLS